MHFRRYLFLLVLFGTPLTLSADRQLAEENGWHYNDLASGISKAKESQQPLMVVIRCPP